ncbi:dihydrolipoamide acetyltransferase family protein [Streptomyces griseoaurantiacus]|uniref:dihydrolipoamide acetyltransferase family protein n=1 Tax=Streptomyces griseoaurantiacus TaxID=68213 RepID=UPI0017813E11|nr:dihydrolipoamide acetyltransferase component of pyruvate dehydrogenase complex [Streptomyces griseoaurantiacus]
MAQVLEFRLPDLGEGLTEAEIVRWLVEVGDVVAVDQPVVEVETAKAMVDVPCPYGGVVTARFGEEGTEMPVGAPLLTVAVGESGSPADGGTSGAGASSDGASGARAPSDGSPGAGSASSGSSRSSASSGSSGAAGSSGSSASSASSGNVLVGYGTSEAPSRRRRVRPASVPASSAVPVPERAPAAPEGGADGVFVRDHEPAGPVAVISPLVRRLARENGVDLRGLSGSGPEGLILRADVENALRAAAARGHTPAPAPVPDEGVVHGTRIPLRGVRGAVADKLSRSRREIPDATCWVDADATELLRARTAMNAAGGPKVSLLALLARICTAALARFPDLNSTVDLEAREVVRLEEVHLGFAAQTERGLVVPVVRDAHARDAESLTAEFARLTEAARAGTLTPADLTGGTFTLNNYGVFGVDGSTPIINHPEAAMLGVGRIVPKPWVHEGELAVRQVVQLSFTFDHRVCDGGTAGGFLRYVADCVEQPAVLLRTL